MLSAQLPLKDSSSDAVPTPIAVLKPPSIAGSNTLKALATASSAASSAATHSDVAELSLRNISISDNDNEPLLKPNPRRFVLFPIQFNEIWQAYKNLEANFWSAEDVEMSDDLADFEKLSRKEQSFVLQTSSILCMGCGLTSEAILSRYSDEIQVPEARCFFGFQLMQKNIHSELSMVILDMFCESEQQRDDLLDVIQQLPSRTLWTNWARTNMTRSEGSFAFRIASLAIFHALHQVSIRDAIAYIAGPHTAVLPATSRETHPLAGVVHAMHKIHHDQSQYISFMAIIKARLVHQANVKDIHNMVATAVDAERTLIEDLFHLSGGSIHLCDTTVVKTALLTRVQFHADRCLALLGFPILYNVQDPLPWIAALLLRESNKNCNETHITPVANTTKQIMEEDHSFTVDEDF
ncbi:hypothetical protein BASA50_004606 [Batrachochytrium salamandrivorans]|uniref:Uncharacterized protein n=1 Tax=Batrachochytrium salamandrivorans TaxID=1357716 RepID=A0ABQ8FF66_9FUNG|nr:hypothetical protein BASA62_008763 [Batrachochytrium salamandrivorans]KAH6574839.1 hypothetical protein BASA60_005310 [Batrachochytrium salamandrivorans]KAH6597255.1 hypothetical protein BASA50_004606 [Batrachochytrium salamandrivorans]KAH6602415.1 hypothetical protein BASA61_001127 [Batrachochytrium salamandrivorans]KAH9268168.1 hypothetical protein BASA84_000363 [Batrachochytrium salamandrivorans]